jgi:hypothetical protein
MPVFEILKAIGVQWIAEKHPCCINQMPPQFADIHRDSGINRIDETKMVLVGMTNQEGVGYEIICWYYFPFFVKRTPQIKEDSAITRR